MSLTRLRRATVAASLALLTTGAAWTLAASPASAAGTDRYVATNGTDNSDCSDSAHPCATIQRAVDNATADNTIHIGAGTYPESVLVGQGDDSATNATFVGAGIGSTKVTGYSAGAGTVGFGFDIENVPATLRDLSVTGVQAGSGNGNGAPGFGVEVQGSSQTALTDVEVSGNANGGVFAEGSQLTVTGSTIDHNGGTASPEGMGFPPCGVFDLAGTASIATSSVSSNTYCGVFAIGGNGPELATPSAAAPTGALTFTQSTAAHNGGPAVIDEFDSAGQVYDSTLADNAGYGLGVTNSDVSVVHSTITGTTKDSNGLGSDEAGITVEDEGGNTPGLVSNAAVNHALRTVSRHQSGQVRRMSVAGVRPAAAAAPSTSTVTVSGSIDAANDTPDCAQHVVDGGYNLSSDKANSCGFSTSKHSLTKTDPQLGALGSHGGATQTALPLKGSPAIDAEPGGTAGCQDADRDQRGVSRPQPAGGRCDLGSVELAAAQLAITPDSLPHGTVGTAYSETLHATGGQYPTYTWALVKGTLPPGITFKDGVFSGTPAEAGSYTVTVSVNDPVDKSYTIVIDAASDHGNGTGGRLADTGVPTLELTGAGALLLLLGWAVLYAAGLVGRRGGRHRRPLA
jgi:hypothetical protein